MLEIRLGQRSAYQNGAGNVPLPTLNTEEQLLRIKQYNDYKYLDGTGRHWQRDGEWAGKPAKNIHATHALQWALRGAGGDTLWATNASSNEPEVKFLVLGESGVGHFETRGFIVTRQIYDREVAAYRRDLAKALGNGTIFAPNGHHASLPHTTPPPLDRQR